MKQRLFLTEKDPRVPIPCTSQDKEPKCGRDSGGKVV